MQLKSKHVHIFFSTFTQKQHALLTGATSAKQQSAECI